jgi:hypothetical protein
LVPTVTAKPPTVAAALAHSAERDDWRSRSGGRGPSAAIPESVLSDSKGLRRVFRVTESPSVPATDLASLIYTSNMF